MNVPIIVFGNGLYSLLPETVRSITGDCTVYYGGLYSPLPETVVIFRLKALDRQQETT